MLLEELLNNYAGTLLLVSHDRTFLDNIVSSTLVFTGDGKIAEYIGGYHDWQEQLRNKAAVKVAPKKLQNLTDQDSALKPSKKPSYKTQLEVNKLIKQIELLEMEKVEFEKSIADPDFYKQNSKKE